MYALVWARLPTSKQPFSVTIDNEKEVLADALIIATGATPNTLAWSRKTSLGQCLGPAPLAMILYKGQDVAVAGGGDMA